jgi:hypothetical protein
MDFVEKLAGTYADLTGRPGIPWDQLGGGINNPEYRAYLDVAFFAFLDVLYGGSGEAGLSEEFRSRYRSIRAKDARSALGQMTEMIEDSGAYLWNALTSGDLGGAVDFPRVLAMDVFATLSANAVNNFTMHNAGIIEAAVLNGNITQEEAMAHADSVVQTFATFVDLSKGGDLDQFKSDPPVAGMGAFVAGWAAVALGSVVVGGICYMLYVLAVAAPIQNKAIEYCDQLTKSGSAEDQRMCVSAMQKMQESGNVDLLGFFGKMLNPVMWVAAIGVGLYVAYLIVPGIIARRRAST